VTGLALVAILGTAAPAAAGIAFGVRGGLSVSSISGESSLIHTSSKYGPGGGVFFTLGVSDAFSVQPEILYVSKGASWGDGQSTDDLGNPTGTYELLSLVDYVEIPVLLRFALPLGSVVRPVLSAGPAVAFEADERLKTTGDLSSSEKVDFYKNTDFGAAAGLGLEMVGGGGIWSLDTRFTRGFTRLERGPLIVTDNHNWNVLVSVGFARAIR